MIVWDKAALKQLDQKETQCLVLTAEALQDEIREAQVIPRAMGTLSGEAFSIDRSTASKGYVRLIFNTPYARRLYFHPEYHFHKGPWVGKDGRKYDGNPNAQGMWMRHWMRGGKYQNRASEIFGKLMKRGL